MERSYHLHSFIIAAIVACALTYSGQALACIYTTNNAMDQAACDAGCGILEDGTVTGYFDGVDCFCSNGQVFCRANDPVVSPTPEMPAILIPVFLLMAGTFLFLVRRRNANARSR